MRQLFVAAVAVVAIGTLHAESQQDKTAQVKGLHLCCKQCEVSVQAILGKVEGVSDVKCDRKAKTVTFTAPNVNAAKKAYDALFAGGFAGTGTYGKTIGFGSDSSKIPGGKTDEVIVKGVHACCGQCIGVLKATFKDAKVTVTGKGTQRDVTIAGKDLQPSEVIQKLEKAGFSGKIEAKK